MKQSNIRLKLGFGLIVVAVMSWGWNDSTRVSLKSLGFLALCSEVWLHRMLSCGNTLLWDRHGGLPDMLKSSAWGFGFLSSSWWAHWTQPAGTESSECLITWLAGAEATQTVRAERISLDRFPGMKSIKAGIIPPSSSVVENAGLEFPLLACALRTDMASSALLHGVALLLPSEVSVLATVSRLPSQLLLGHKTVSAGGCSFAPGKGAYVP